jgi:hypothetical protein
LADECLLLLLVVAVAGLISTTAVAVAVGIATLVGGLAGSGAVAAACKPGLHTWAVAASARTTTVAVAVSSRRAVPLAVSSRRAVPLAAAVVAAHAPSTALGTSVAVVVWEVAVRVASRLAVAHRCQRRRPLR